MRSISAVGVSRRMLAVGAGILILAILALLRLAPGAQAAELLFWDNYGANPDNVAFANIDGSGGGLLNLGSAELDSPEGLAYDSVTNRLFTTSNVGPEGQILAIALDGSGAASFTAPGAPIEEPEGVAVDPTTRTIYWANYKGEGSIAWAKLDGSEGGTLNTTGATLKSPCCRIAIDTVGGRIYWVNESGVISYAKLDNTGGGGDLNLTGTTVKPGGEGLAADPASGRLYFLGGTNQIGYANLNGSGGGDVSVGGGVINGPWGMAFDPSIGRLYWGNESNAKVATNAIGFVDPAGTSGGGISIATAPVANPQDPLIVKSPVNTGRPKLHGRTLRSKPGKTTLHCSTGSWGADFVGSFVYRAPRSFSYKWKRSGKRISGAKATHRANTPGKYVCIVTATNQAGSASKASKPFKVKKPRKKRH